jgi:hypothetical protein
LARTSSTVDPCVVRYSSTSSCGRYKGVGAVHTEHAELPLAMRGLRRAKDSPAQINQRTMKTAFMKLFVTSSIACEFCSMAPSNEPYRSTLGNS